jgi:predicted SPOUT superfamily RNA methylase MTH1
MTLGGKKVCLAIPDTLLEEHDTVRDKTMKLGQVARYCSIFGVDAVRVFHDSRGRGESRFIKLVLEYLETPQYLRRRLFPLTEDLRFAGLLPPLRIPSHKPKVPIQNLRAGEFREGVVLADGMTVDIGLERPAELRRKEPANKRVTLKIVSADPRIEASVVTRGDPQEYWGYTVEVSGPNALADPRFPLMIATSRRGDPLDRVIRRLRKDIEGAPGLMLIFGPPSRGLFEIFGKDLRQRVGHVVNLFPEQLVVTVRSEEAIFSGLYLVDLLTSRWFPPFG